ncbi:MAG: hypothetical protein N3I35_02555 [Clostridia bacterium]|nr:hypothetical protein [Clostridia bacterium]
MQLQGLMMMLFFTIVIPIIIMSANHNIFFMLVAAILLVISLKDIPIAFFHITKPGNNGAGENNDIAKDEEIAGELEDLTNINVKKFSTGVNFARSLILILFFLYCIFNVSSLPIKILITAILLYCMRVALNTISSHTSTGFLDNHPRLRAFTSLIIDLSIIFTIIVVAYNKYVKNIM